MAPLKDAAEKTGINLSGPHEWKGIKILKCNANHMECFEDDKFGLVMCNAMIEHDKYFWKTIAEIKRVTKARRAYSYWCARFYIPEGRETEINAEEDSGSVETRGC
jgi:ubiquinone/menaquinone biosynthesis C-methylase UbiE